MCERWDESEDQVARHNWYELDTRENEEEMDGENDGCVRILLLLLMNGRAWELRE